MPAKKKTASKKKPAVKKTASKKKPAKKKAFLLTTKIHHQGSIGEKVDVRAPSLVLPIAASSRVVANTHEAIIWFDKTLEDKDLLVFIQNALVSQLLSDDVSYDVVESSTKYEPESKSESKTEIYESDWYHSEVDTGWLFTDIELSTSLRFRYEFFLKPHGRSVSLKVS